MTDPAFLLDTNILVYLAGGSSATLREQVERHEPGALVTSSLCVAEVLFGLGESVEACARFDAVLEIIPVQPFDLAAARCFPRVPFRRGKVDRFIAAHCLALDLTLVTNNESDFADVPGLRIENWTRP